MIRELIDALNARIKSPVFGWFIFSWVVFNWKALLFLISNNLTAEEKINRFEQLTNSQTLIWFPIIVAATIAIVYHWINLIFLFFSKKPIDLKNYLQAESDHNLLIRKKRLEEARSELLAAKEKDLIERAKRYEDILSISDDETKEKLKVEIDSLRSKVDDLNNNIIDNVKIKNKSNSIGSDQMTNLVIKSISDEKDGFKTIQDIARETGLSLKTINRALDSLFITKFISEEDGRNGKVYLLTPKGREIFSQIIVK